jgi:hypothetical protein
MQSRTYRLDRMFHNLTCMEVTFKFVPYLRGLSKWNWMTKLLQNSPKLQTLIIDDIDVRHCPLSFSLFLSSCTCIYFKKNSTVHHCQVDIFCCTNGGTTGEWSDPTTVPECLSSHLTTCTIRNYSRFNCGFEFAKYIMQNSRVLRTMTIQSSKSLETDAKIQMLKELCLCPIIPATCKLLFSWMIMVRLCCNSSFKIITNLVITPITFNF